MTENFNAELCEFTNETSFQDKWRTVCDKISTLNVSNQNEDLSFLKYLLTFLQKLNNSTNYHEHLGDPQEKEYFFSEVLLNCAKSLLQIENPFSGLLEVSNSCLEQMVLFWIKAIYEDHPKLTEMAKIIFDIDNPYHKENNQENMVPEVIASFNREPSQEHTDWINALKKDDVIDCIKIESRYKLMGWSHAQVVEVTPQSIRISYLGEKDYQRTLQKVANANEIAPYKTKCKDFDWRMGLIKGDEVDICDTCKVWYNSTVLSTRVNQVDQKTLKEILIGYRVYDNHGNRIDEEGKYFFGWSSTYDEWINVTSARITKKGAMAKTFSLTSSQTDDFGIEDSNDLVYSVEDVKIFSITRPKYCKSVMVVRMINKFGEAGGFDKILERINNTEKWAPIEIVSQIVSLVAKINPVLHREFVKEFFPKFWRTVWKNLMNSPEGNIRNFTKERINDIKNGFGELLKRIYSLPENIDFIEKFYVGISAIWPELILKKTAVNMSSSSQDDFAENIDKVDVPIGPFSIETFNQEKWRVIIGKMDLLQTAEEALPYLKELLRLLKELNTCTNYNHYFGDLSIKDFFFTDFLPTAAKNLMEVGVLNNSIALDLFDNCLEEIALFLIKTIEEDHSKLMEIALRLFDNNAGYYKSNNQEEVIPGIIPSFNKANREHIDWINSLQIGDLVDCVKVEFTYKLMCWSHAKVIDVTPNMITVSYLHERDCYNKSLAKLANSNEIAPYQSKCNDFEWRFNIKKGDIIDACTTGAFCAWFHGTVLDERLTKIDEERTIKEILVGYRVYTENGNRTDNQGRKYHGWPSKYDDWFPVTDPRVSKKNTFTKKFFEYTGPIASDPIIEDSNDNIYSVQGSKIYAITRPRSCSSISLVKIINKFGEAGGFDRILERISKTGNGVPLRIVGQMVKLIANINCVLHREFVQEYVPKLWEALLNHLENTTETENFAVEDTKASFNELLKRIYHLPQKNKLLEKLNLCMCSAFLNSNIRDHKLKGLSLLMQIAKDIQNGRMSDVLDIAGLNSFVSRNSFLAKTFGTKVDIKLIQRNEGLLRFLIRQNKLTHAEFLDIINSNDKKEFNDINQVTKPVKQRDFPQEKWNILAEKISLLNVINQEEAIPIVKDISSFLSELNSSFDYNAYFGDHSVKEYLLEEFFPNFAKYLVQALESSDSIASELYYSCFEQIMLFWVKVIPEDNAKLAKTAKLITDLDKKQNLQEFLMEINPPFNIKANEKHFDWVNSLKQGDLIDCIKIETKYNLICWSHASITEISLNQIKVSYVGENDNYDRTLDKIANANEIAPYKTKCKDFVWRNNLKIGRELDVCDTSSIWYNATVLNVKEDQISNGRIVKQIHIGYRIYDKKGNQVEKDGKKFFGWASKYDEWIHVTSPRISKKNSFAKNFIPNLAQGKYQSILDSNDKVYSVEGIKTYAVARSQKLQNMMAVKLANKFGEAGGFDRILERISNTNSWAPIKVVCQIVAMIGNIGLLLHRDFAQDYIPQLKKAVWKNLLESPDSNLKNFTLKRIEMIHSAFDCLLNRIYNSWETDIALEKLDLSLCSICFDSNFIEVKSFGLKIFLKLIKNALNNKARLAKTDYLTLFMSKKSIFNLLDTKGSIHLIQRLAGLMLTEGELSSLQMEDIWSFAKTGNYQEKLALYKILSDIASDLSESEVNFITDKIHEVYQKIVTMEEIELLFQLNISCKSKNAARKAVEYFWSILIYFSDQLPSSIIDLTLKKFCELLKNERLQKERAETICSCVENILAGQSYSISLNIFKNLLGSEDDDASIRNILTRLFSEKNLLSKIMEDLRTFENKIENLKDEKGVMCLPPNDSSIQDRIQMIFLLTTNLEPGFVDIDELYNELCNQTFKDLFYQYTKEILRGRRVI